MPISFIIGLHCLFLVHFLFDKFFALFLNVFFCLYRTSRKNLSFLYLACFSSAYHFLCSNVE
ncbi:hypothetical protein CW304_06205 [Bacillus sp. UFRGS-B20]|nr:hypothetical protein CW304_06205 [Bacillus sp. UFRGS-B20]